MFMTVLVEDFSERSFTIKSDRPCVLMLSEDATMTVADPTQSATKVSITIDQTSGEAIPGWGSRRQRVFGLNLPRGSSAGSHVAISLTS
jgi:hypothetical protein